MTNGPNTAPLLGYSSSLKCRLSYNNLPQHERSQQIYMQHLWSCYAPFTASFLLPPLARMSFLYADSWALHALAGQNMRPRNSRQQQKTGPASLQTPPLVLRRYIAWILDLGVAQDLGDLLDGHETQVALVTLAHGHLAVCDLLVPHDEHVGDLLLLRLGDLDAHGLV